MKIQAKCKQKNSTFLEVILAISNFIIWCVLLDTSISSSSDLLYRNTPMSNVVIVVVVIDFFLKKGKSLNIPKRGLIWDKFDHLYNAKLCSDEKIMM